MKFNITPYFVLFLIFIIIIVIVIIIAQLFKKVEKYSSEKTVKILFPKNSTWDYDYSTRYIFKDIPVKVDQYLESDITELLKQSKYYKDCVLIVNISTLENIEKLASSFRPKIIIHLSDEAGIRNEWTILNKYTKLYLYTYKNKNYIYPWKSIHIPVGFVTGFIPVLKPTYKINTTKASERKYNCSFIGQLKNDREEMLSHFKTMENCFFDTVVTNWSDINALKYKPSDLFTIYSNSKIIINGRGNVTLECYRIYEAIVAGSIPVIVGTKEEIDFVFEYFGKTLPIVYYSSWDIARKECDLLITNPEKLNIIQQNLISWWEEFHDELYMRIKNVIY